MVAEGNNQSILAQLGDFMKSMDTPDWLIKDTLERLKVKHREIDEGELYDYLLHLGRSSSKLPEAFMNREWLASIYEKHETWVENEVSLYVELSHESFEKHIENSPIQVQGYSEAAQKAYIAVNTHLLNVFSQIDEMKPKEERSKKIVKSKEESDSSGKKMLSALQSFIGYILIIFAYIVIIGLFMLIQDEGFIAYATIYIFLGIIPFVVGVVMTRKGTFKNFYKQHVSRVYFYFSFVLPVVFTLFLNIVEWKKGLIRTEETIYLADTANFMLGFFHFALIAIVIILLGIIIINKGKKKKFVLALTIFLVVFFGYQGITLNDYMAINEDRVIYSPLGKKVEYSWDEVEQVELIGEVNEKYNPRGKGEEKFVWSFTFDMVNGDQITFGTFYYKESGLKTSLKIKDKLASEHIPMNVHLLSEDEASVLNIEKDLDDDNHKQLFDELFE